MSLAKVSPSRENIRSLERRRFLNGLGMGLGLTALQSLESSRLLADSPRKRSHSIDPLNPFAARAPDFAPRAKSVIFLFMVGGPSQVDTFDYKPILQSLHGKPVPEAIRKAVEATRHANVF